MPALIYVQYSELTGETPTESRLNEILCSLDKGPAFFMLVMVNLLLSIFYKYSRAQETQQVHSALVDFFLDERLFGLLRQKLSGESAVTRPVFHRQQLLALARRVLEASSDEGAGDNPFESVEARHRLGIACLLENDFLVSPDQS